MLLLLTIDMALFACVILYLIFLPELLNLPGSEDNLSLYRISISSNSDF
jgi:hypothetical protein